MTTKPLFNNVLIERIEANSKTAGGIIIPDTAKEKPAEGKVVEVGAGAIDDSGKRIPMEVKKGDVVLFGKWGGTEITVNGKEMVILKESDILAIIQ